MTWLAMNSNMVQEKNIYIGIILAAKKVPLLGLFFQLHAGEAESSRFNGMMKGLRCHDYPREPRLSSRLCCNDVRFLFPSFGVRFFVLCKSGGVGWMWWVVFRVKFDPQGSHEALAGGDRSIQKNAIMVGSYREPNPCLNPCWSCDSLSVNN